MFNNCPKGVFTKISVSGGYFALLQGCILINWNSPLAFSLVFTSYLSNAVVSEKSPHSFLCPCSTEDVGIAHKPPRSL